MLIGPEAMPAAPCLCVHMNEISPRLFLGSIHSASDRSAIAARGITHIISVLDCDIGHRQRVRMAPSEEDACTRLVIAVQDATSTRLDRHFDACSAFISEGLSQGGSVLVHCKAGQSRSATVVIAHLMREERWPVNKALQFVQQRRPSVQPNVAFMEQLRALEVRLGLPEIESPDADSKSETAELQEQQEEAPEVEALSEADEAETTADDVADIVSAADVQVEVADLFGANENRLRCERFRSRCQRFRSSGGLLGVAAPLRKRRYK